MTPLCASFEALGKGTGRKDEITMINKKDEQNATNGADFESVVERAEALIEKMDRIIEKLDEVIKAMEVHE